MTQTLAIFSEAYRNLNSRKLFWISIGISGLVVLAFALVGINDRGIKIVTWQIDSDLFNTRLIPPAVFYKTMFVSVGISIWLTWIATILALVSTAGIFPDLMTSGSIDLYASKPISRLRLFLTEYAAGLLFVTLQVAVFSLASFLVIGLRGGVWEPGLFVAVPLVVCLFSYLFAVCVLLGILTRSTVASLLLTLIFWFIVWAITTTEQTLLMEKTFEKHKVSLGGMVAASSRNGTSMTKVESPRAAQDRPEDGTDSADGQPSAGLETAHRVFYVLKTLLPKTSDTVDLLRRTLVRMAELPDDSRIPDPRLKAAQREFAREIENRSAAWIVGTSLGFEAVMLALAALVFCRRDF